MTDAESTARFMLGDAIAQTALSTGITADRAEPLIDELYNALLNPGTIWAFRELTSGPLDILLEEARADAESWADQCEEARRLLFNANDKYDELKIKSDRCQQTVDAYKKAASYYYTEVEKVRQALEHALELTTEPEVISILVGALITDGS